MQHIAVLNSVDARMRPLALDCYFDADTGSVIVRSPTAADVSVAIAADREDAVQQLLIQFENVVIDDNA